MKRNASIELYLCMLMFMVYEFNAKVSTNYVLAAIVLCLPFAIVGLAPYNSPFAFCIAAGFFILFKRFAKCGKWVLYVAPSMFSVYLLHSTKPGLEFIREAGNCLVNQGVLKGMMFLLVAISLFAVCLVIDLARRFILFNLRKVLNG